MFWCREKTKKQRNNMKRAINMAIIGVAAIIITGCRSEMTRHSPISTETAGTTFKYISSTNEQNNTDFFRTAYKNSSTDESAQEKVRASIAYEVMELIDEEYSTYEINLRSDRAYKDSLTQIASIALSSAATVTGTSNLKTILSAIDTGLKGANAAIDTEVYRDKASEALISQMRASRAKSASVIYNGLKKPIVKYPLEALRRDLGNYYRAGNLTSALVDLASQSTQAATSAEDKALKARNLQ
jgi:hypothetical protein